MLNKLHNLFLFVFDFSFSVNCYFSNLKIKITVYVFYLTFILSETICFIYHNKIQEETKVVGHDNLSVLIYQDN